MTQNLCKSKEILTLTILRKVANEMGGGSCDYMSAWGVESSISVSMQAIKVREAPERSEGR